MANTSIRVDTVGLGINWALGETYRVAMDEGFIRQSDGLNLPIAGNTSIMTFSTPATPPQIANTIPTHTSTAPINITDISFTIDRSVGNLTILGGNVFVNRQGSPNVVVKTFAVSNASITGNTVAFSIIGNLEASQTYFITSNANIFLDRDGFKNNAITNSSSFRFVSPTAPTVTAFTPGNATVASRNFTNVAIDFDRTIFSNSGNLFLHNANTSAVIRTYPISSGLISNNKVTLDVIGNISANGYYYISSNANVVMDVTQIKYPGLTNASTFTFKAPVSPYLESTVPTNTTTSASRSLTTASFTLDRTVTAVSGNVYLYEQSSPNVLLKTWTIGSNVTFNSDRTFTVTVPQGMLAPTQAYYVTTDANIAKDLTYINFPGISTTGNTFTFTTDVAPLLSNTFPTYGTALDENASNISFTMDRLVSKNVGNVYLYRVDTVNGNSLVKTYDITANTYLLSNTTVNLPITSLLKVMESYYVTSDYDILKDFTTNEKYRGIINSNTFVFTTSVNRTYVGDRFNLLFPDNIPQITETDLGDTYTVSLQLSSAIGQIQALNDNFASPTGWNSGTNTFTVTGNKTAVNSTLSGLYFFPYVGVTSSATITFTQSKNSVFQKSQLFTLSMSSASPGYVTVGGNTYSIPEDSKFNFMPFYIYPSWNSNCVVMVKSIQSGNVAIDPGKFYANTATGWTNANDGVIYKAFNRPANVAVYNSQVAEVRDIYYWLSSDYTTSFSIDALLGIESTRSGNLLSGGTVYSVSNNYNITPETEYNLLTSGTYSEDGSTAITLTIEDDDVHPNITYNVQMQQISPDPGLITGSFTSPGVGIRSWGSISDTQVKSAWNQVTYYAPADYTGSILIGATITKIQTGQANVTLASNVAINLTNSATHNEYSFNNDTYADNSWSYLNYSITDEDTNSPTYYVTITQISPDPITTPANIIVSDIDYGTTWSVSGSRSTISDAVKRFYQFPDYIGNIVFGLTQIKSSYNGNITQAANVTATYTNSLNTAKYSLSSSGVYAEDIDRAIDLTITDPDTRFENYYINVRQISPDSGANVANIILGSSYGSNVTIYANRATINGLTKTITPPGDWTSNIVLGYTQIKSTIFGNITQADNVAVTYTNITSHTEFALPIASANVYSNVSYAIPQSIYSGNASVSNSNVELALLGNGPISSSTIVDSSTNAYSITNTGGVVYSTAQTKYAATSLYFNGSSQLSLASNTNLQMPADFTWEVWVYPTVSGTKPIISFGAWGRFMLFTNGQYEITGGVGNFLATGTITGAGTNAWTHFAVTRQSNTVRIFRNGTLSATHTISGTPESTNSPLYIGFYSGDYFTGYMENIVYVKGQALYTASFTPSNWTFSANTTTNFGINDLANNKSYSVTLSVDNNLANIYQGNVSRGTSWTITGTKANVNTSLSNVSLLPGYYNGVESFNLNYIQTQTTDNIPQANVQIPITGYPIPAVPTIGTAVTASNVIGNVSATISYTAPTLTGAINYYSGVAVQDSTKTGINISSTSGNILIGNLTPGTAYTFRVNATSSYGNSAYSANSNSLTIYTPPAAPTIGTATALSNSSASITYIAPTYTGGRSIASYTAISNPGNLIGYVNQSGTGTIYINGLDPTTEYTFTVYASHLNGNSVVSSVSNAVTTYANALPYAPTNIVGSPINGSIIDLNWTAPAYTGNVALSSYVIDCNVGNINLPITISPATYKRISGLTQPVWNTSTGILEGNVYQFSIYAINSYGNSSIAYSNSVMTLAVPRGPGISATPSVVATDGTRATIGITPISQPYSYYSGGSPVTSYTGVAVPTNLSLANVSVTIANASVSIGTTLTFTTLTPGEEYTFYAYATNAIGNSPLTSYGTITTTGIPSAPTAEINYYSNIAMRLDYTIPSSYGTPISSYLVTTNPGNIVQFLSATIPYNPLKPGYANVLITGLSNSVSYTTTIQAVNSVGAGASTSFTYSPRPISIGFQDYNITLANASMYSTGLTTIGTSNFCLEFWIYNKESSSTSSRGIVDLRGGGAGGGFALRTNGDGYLFIQSSSTTGLSVSTGRTGNVWQHIAVERVSSTVTLYIDGTAVATQSSNNINYTSAALRLSGFYDDLSSNACFKGAIDELRLSKTARYNGNFTPSRSELTSDANTIVLYHFNGLEEANGGSRYIQLVKDSGPSGRNLIAAISPSTDGALQSGVTALIGTGIT